MKQIGKLAVISAALALAAAQTQAAPKSGGTQTVQPVVINLSGVQQNSTNSSATSPVKISNSEILQALGGTGSNGVFSTKAKLVAITPLDGSSPTGIFVRDVVNKQNVDTDVSGNFGNSTLASVTGGTGNKSTETSIQNFTFTSDTLSYDVQGYTTGNPNNNQENSAVNGSGSVNGNTAILKGSISLGPGKVE